MERRPTAQLPLTVVTGHVEISVSRSPASQEKNKTHCVNPRKHVCWLELPPQLQVCHLFRKRHEQRQGGFFLTPKSLRRMWCGTFDTFNYISVTYRAVLPTTRHTCLLLSEYFAPSGIIAPESINTTLSGMLTRGITCYFSVLVTWPFFWDHFDFTFVVVCLIVLVLRGSGDSLLCALIFFFFFLVLL